MNRYNLSASVSGYFCCTVTADSEDEACSAAYRSFQGFRKGDLSDVYVVSVEADADDTSDKVWYATVYATGTVSGCCVSDSEENAELNFANYLERELSCGDLIDPFFETSIKVLI